MLIYAIIYPATRNGRSLYKQRLMNERMTYYSTELKVVFFYPILRTYIARIEPQYGA